MRTTQTTALGYAAFLAADAFRWENYASTDPVQDARLHTLYCYQDIAMAAHKPLPFGPREFEEATLAAIECFAQLQVSGLRGKRTA